MQNLPDDSSLLCIHHFKHQSVRDLAWCCISAPIMQRLPGIETHIFPAQEYLPDNHPAQPESTLWRWLCGLDAHPIVLNEHLAKRKSTRLGIYYEALWHFYFSHHPQWQLLHYNLQIDNQGITLGALDFLCRYNKQYFHIETAVKFYLCNTNNPQDAQAWRSWIGPSSDDRLDIKLAHLVNHQLPLHQHNETQQILQKHYPDVAQWRSALCLQGYLFSPAPMQFNPAHSHPHHGHGYWWYLQHFLYHLQQPERAETQWVIIERHRWLSPVHVDNPKELLTTTELSIRIKSQLNEIKRPLLIAALIASNSTGNTIWRESLRGFVVPDHWPEN